MAWRHPSSQNSMHVPSIPTDAVATTASNSGSAYCQCSSFGLGNGIHFFGNILQTSRDVALAAE